MFDWNSTLKYFGKVGLVVYFLLTLSLSLLIPRLFLKYHKNLVYKDLSSGSRSLYWGTAIVSLFLVIFIMLSKLIILCPYFDLLVLSSMIPSVAVEIIIPLIFLVTSIFASRHKSVPIPASKFTTRVLLICCCHLCCSSQCKCISKAVQVLTLWAFMTVIYYHIMEVIALVFVSFISIPLTISYVLMYVSVVFFAIMLVSIILHSCQSTGRSRSISAKVLAAVDVCATLLGSSFVIIVFVSFITMSSIFSTSHDLKVNGFEIVSLKFSLLPSIALSVAGWLIKKKLQKEEIHTIQLHNPTDHGTTGQLLKNGDTDEQSTEEQQHFLA